MYRYRLSDHIDNKKFKIRSIKKLVFSKKDWLESDDIVDLGIFNHLIIEEKDELKQLKKVKKEENNTDAK